ncbi:6-phospho-3-hexuloisomerase [Mycolicibacterium sp. HS_4_1]
MSVKVEQPHSFGACRETVIVENQRLFGTLSDEAWDRAGVHITSARSVFVVGGGRSGLAVQMAAMRLMHLGLDVHVAGAVTAPAIDDGDLLIAVSGSGTTASAVAAAQTAKRVGAKVIAVTTASGSPLAQLADEVLTVPAADKQDHSGAVTLQYAGSLFEQSVLLGFDALFLSLWRTSDQTAERLWRRHANIG